MSTFHSLDRQIGLVPASAARTLGEIDTARGREDAFRHQRPRVLEALVEVARIQSTEASNAIEGVVAPRRRIRELVAEKTTPRNRSEAEIAGYRKVLDTIPTSAEHVSFRPSVVEQLHRDLYSFTSVPAGRWKTVENAISEELPDGTTRVRFQTVPAGQTPAAMAELHERFLFERDAGTHHPLLLIGCYVFDFLERLVIETSESYYEALQTAGHGWHDDQHDIWPWLEYLLGIVLAAYREFEELVGVIGQGRGAKGAAIEKFVRSGSSDEFTIADVREAALGASDSLIGKVLARLRNEGVIESLGTGRSARWRRLFPPR